MESEVFKEKSTAYLHLKWDREKMVSMMCPIFKTKCLGQECHSYFQGAVIGYGPNENRLYRKHPPLCTNAIVSGTIEYQEP